MWLRLGTLRENTCTVFSTELDLFMNVLWGGGGGSICKCKCVFMCISTELSVQLEAFKQDFCCLLEVYADAWAFDSPLTQGQPCVTDCFLVPQRRREGKRGGTGDAHREEARRELDKG